MKRATYFSFLASLAIAIIPAHQASALDAKVKHKSLTVSQKRLLADKKLTSTRSIRNTGAERMLNPQPLPPGPPPDAYKSTKLKSTYHNRGSAVSLNPQPLPPGPPPDKLKSSPINRNTTTDRMQNLQQLQLDRRTTGVR